MEVVDEPLRRILRLKFELGLFENPYADVEKMQELLQADSHRKMSYELACESMVLLENKNQILSLKDCKKVAVIGPEGDNYRALFGGYAYPAFYEGMRNMLTGMSKSMGLEGVEAQAEQKAFLEQMLSTMPEVEKMAAESYTDIKTVYDAIKDAVSAEMPEAEVCFARGCDFIGDSREGFTEAVDAATGSDVILFLCGGRNGSSDGCTMGENVDASHVGLPGVQEELARKLAESGKPLVLVHMDGRPLSSAWAKEHAAAILEAWHPGQMGAQAIADTLIGRNNPGGKLPVTAVRHEGQIPVYAEQARGSGVSGRGAGNNNITQGYVDETGFPLYPFGFGLSYTNFDITDCRVSDSEMEADGEIRVCCTVTNTGKVTGDEVVQLYFTDKLASIVRPNKELAGFKRISLQPGESRQVEFIFAADQTAFLGTDMEWRVEAGETELFMGNSSEHLISAGIVRIKDTRSIKGGRRTFYSGLA